MKDLFNKEDLLNLKWKILLAIFSICLAGGIYYGADIVNTDMNNSLRTARAELQRAQTDIDQIEEEEATIIEYIGRYQDLTDAGIVNNEDRLQLLEMFAQIRENNDLFPISVNIGEQSSLRLLYDQFEPDPGGPIDLNVTSLELSLPLLHENDLTHLLDELLSSPGLYLPEECSVGLRNPNATNFIVLGQHLEANCDLLWFTFDVSPPPEPTQFF